MNSLDSILDAASTDASKIIGGPNPPIEDVDPADLDAEDLPDASSVKWKRVEGVVAVFADLENSTQMSIGKHPRSTAKIYRAATGNAVKIFHEFEADFIQIQGDGTFGLFWGAQAIERAICAGITVKTFSQRHLEPVLEQRWPDAPQTGFKVGVAVGRVLVKNIGTPRNTNEQEPIWAGKPVNYAAKAAQQANRGELIVTGSVWLAIENNDFLTTSCGHGGTAGSTVTPAPLWQDVTINKLDHDEDEAAGRMLTAPWCTECGPGFVNAILSGETTRTESAGVRELAASTSDPVRAERWSRMRRGLSGWRGEDSARRL